MPRTELRRTPPAQSAAPGDTVPDWFPPDGGGCPPYRIAMLRFAAGTALVGLLLGAAMAYLLTRFDERQALDRARTLAERLANDVVGPALDLRDPESVASLRGLMASRVQDGMLVRIKVWTADGRIVWADDERLIDRRFALEPEDIALLGTRRGTADVTELERPENQYERETELIEVYAGFFDRSGRPLLFEAYLPIDRLEPRGLLRAPVLALAAGWLLLLQLLVLPVAALLTRRAEQAHRGQRRLLQHALEAGELERKRLAQDLHDGVIQDLAGVSYVLSSLETRLRRTTEGGADLDTTARAGAIVRRDVVALRTVCMDLYPPDLGGGGLTGALEDLAAQAGLTGLHATLEVDEELVISHRTALVTYRLVREALRNVVKHAHASHVHVQVAAVGSGLRVQVRDDGAGFDVDGPSAQGHLGIRVLRDSATDVGGSFDLTSRPAEGTTVTATLPMG